MIGRIFSVVTPAAALAVALIADLILGRIGGQIVDSPRWVDAAGFYSFHLAGVLALIVDALGTFGIIQDERLLARSARLWFALVGAIFLPLAAVALFANLPDALEPNLNTSFALGVVGLTAGLVARRGRTAGARPREKFGLALLALPVLAHATWLFLRQMPFDSAIGDAAPPVLFRAGQVVALSVGPAAALLFARAPLIDLVRGWPLAAGLGVAGALLGALGHPEGIGRVLSKGFGLARPATGLGRAALVAGGATFAALLAGLARRPGRDRACALGLFYVATAGYTIQLPYQMLAAHAGFVLLLRAATWPATPSVEVGPERWQSYARAVATALGAGEPLVIGDGTSIITRIRRAGALPLDVRIVRRGQEVREIDVTVGVVPSQPPAYTTGGNVRPRSVKLPHGADAIAALGFELPPELEDGWLGLWPQEAIMFRAFPEAACAIGPVPLAAIALETNAPRVAAELVALVNAVEQVASRAELRA
ncbi:MAG: hypothetical protein AABZ30_11705 [Myxococcota bacterium]